jgi:hypothetical protein
VMSPPASSVLKSLSLSAPISSHPHHRFYLYLLVPINSPILE